MYHIINRGNDRKDLFESVGAAEAFLKVLAEAMPRFGWELARRVRDKSAAPYRWLADSLDLGRPESLRSYLCRQRKSENQQTTA